MNNPIATQVIKPNPYLSTWVECYMVLRPLRVPKNRDIWTIMPDGCAHIILHIYENTNHSTLSFVGPRSIYKNINRQGRCLTVVFKFKSGRIAPFLPFPVNEIKDQSVPFKNVWPQLNDEIIEKMATFGQFGKINQCIDLFEQMLINISYHQSRKLNPTVHRGISLINQTGGKYRINHLADCLGVPSRHLRNLFHIEVGLNPKRLAKIVRVTEVVKRIDGGVTDNWTANAHRADYYDQSHLIDDFNLLLGQSPERFINRTNREEII